MLCSVYAEVVIGTGDLENQLNHFIFATTRLHSAVTRLAARQLSNRPQEAILYQEIANTFMVHKKKVLLLAF